MAKSPNILFLLPDQHRPDWVGTNPDVPVRTPNLDAIAARGVRFDNALCPSPLCAPCRAALAAGMEYDRCRVPSNGEDYPLDARTFYRMLRDTPTEGAPDGYHVTGCGKFDLAKALRDWGLYGKRRLPEWGFSDGVDNEGKLDGTGTGAEYPRGPYLKHLHDRGLADAHVQDFRSRQQNRVAAYTTPLPDDAYCDNWLSAVGLDLLRNAPPDKPWFLQVNFTGPHNPWDITESMERTVRGRTGFPPPAASEQFTPAEHEAVRQNYTAMVENIDARVGEFLAEVERRGEMDNTLIVFSSDHGEMLGDHQRWGKSTWHQPSVGVPLAVAGPGVRSGAVIDSPATILDLTATFLDWAGIAVPADMDSRSLRPVLEGETDATREVALSGLHGWRVAVDGRYKLVLRTGEPPLLYDLTEDPHELRDIAAEKPEVVERLSQQTPQP